MPNVVDIIVRSKDQTKGGFSSAKGEAQGFQGSLKRVGETAAGFLSANLIGVAAERIKTFISGSITAASELNETMSKTDAVFGTSAGNIHDWAKGAVDSMGLSRNAAETAAGSLGLIFTQMGTGSKAAAGMSEKWVQLASDIGSFNNADPTEVLDAMQGATRGEYDALQKYVPTISAAAVQHEALAMTGKHSADELTAHDNLLAVQKIMFEQTTKAQGDFARTGDQNANSQKKASAAMENAQAALGKGLLPVMTLGAQVMERLGKIMSTHPGLIMALAAVVGGILVAAFTAWAISAGTAAAATLAAAWPVLAIIAVIALVVAAIFLLAKHWHTIWNAIKAVAVAVWHGIQAAVGAGVNFVKTVISTAWNWIKENGGGLERDQVRDLELHQRDQGHPGRGRRVLPHGVGARVQRCEDGRRRACQLRESHPRQDPQRARGSWVAAVQRWEGGHPRTHRRDQEHDRRGRVRGRWGRLHHPQLPPLQPREGRAAFGERLTVQGRPEDRADGWRGHRVGTCRGRRGDGWHAGPGGLQGGLRGRAAGDQFGREPPRRPARRAAPQERPRPRRRRPSRVGLGMTFPQTPLGLTLELLINGTWTDITSLVYGREDMVVARGRSDEAGQVDRSTAKFQSNNRSGNLSPRNPTGTWYGLIGRNTRMRARLSPSSPGYLLMPVELDGAETPDSANLSITGDIDIRIDVAADDWGAVQSGLCNKFVAGGNQRSWSLAKKPDGIFSFSWSADGSTTITKISTAAITPPAAGGRLALRVTLGVDNAPDGNDVKFYTSDTIAGTWTQLGTTVTTAGTTSIFDSTAPVQFGRANAGIGLVDRK